MGFGFGGLGLDLLSEVGLVGFGFGCLVGWVGFVKVGA